MRDRNVTLTAAGYAPYYPNRELDAPELSAIRHTIDRILNGHAPHPALAVDHDWRLISVNAGARKMMADVAPHLLQGEINVLRLSLHPEGLAPRVLNLAEWREHLLVRLDHDIERSADVRLARISHTIEASVWSSG